MSDKQKKMVPYAVANYEEIVEENYYFVDKTEFIAPMEAHKAPVFCVPGVLGRHLCALFWSVITM